MEQETFKMLINRVVAGDKAAFRPIVEEFQGFVYAVSFKMMGNPHEAEEAVQETFIKVWRNLARFDADKNFKTWLYKIVVNLCYDKLKALKSKNKVFSFDWSESVLLNQSSHENIEQQVIDKECIEIIMMLSQDLTTMQKMIFILSELEQLTVPEIMKITNLSPEKIKSNLYLARKNMKEKLIQITENEER